MMNKKIEIRKLHKCLNRQLKLVIQLQYTQNDWNEPIGKRINRTNRSRDFKEIPLVAFRLSKAIHVIIQRKTPPTLSKGNTVAYKFQKKVYACAVSMLLGQPQSSL